MAESEATDEHVRQYLRRHEHSTPILAVGPHDARVTSGAQSSFHHSPVLRVGVQVADVTSTARAHETGSAQLTKERRPTNNVFSFSSP